MRIKIIKKVFKKSFFYFAIPIFLFSCNENKGISNPNNIWIEKISPQMISQLKIKSRKKTEIKTDFSIPTVILSGGNAFSPNKIRSIEYYNSDGLCILEVIPSYKIGLNDTTGYSKLSELEKLSFPKEVESNEPTGFYDSTFYFYDENDSLIKLELHKTNQFGISNIEFIENYTYDNKNKIIQKCYNSEFTNDWCRYTNFKYNKSGQVISEIDSFTLDIQRPDRPNKGQVRIYRYNSQGMVSSINETNFIYNEKKELIEKNTTSGNLKTDIEYYTYDSNGNCVKIEHIRSVLSTFDPKTNLTTVQKFDTSLLLRQYDKNSLIIESSYKHVLSNRDYSLYKYEYTY
jgi:hypothetical protein